ncbi:MAG: sulfite exporter TauE/SafE family protein [Candidatus Nezhaarchaeales archaeon]
MISGLLPILLFLTSFSTGFLGAIFGIGGGVVLIPVLSVFLGMPIKKVIAASLICAVATSVASTRNYLSQELVNLRLALFLESSAMVGSLLGVFLAVIAPSSVLYIVLGLVLLMIAIIQFRGYRAEDDLEVGGSIKKSKDPLAEKLKLAPEYYNSSISNLIGYDVVNSRLGLMASLLAGMLSSSVGLGGGALKVPIMNKIMKVPMKVSIATSTFMVGLTSSVGVIAYFSSGLLDLSIVPIMVLGITLGSTTGTKVMTRLRSSKLALAFGLLLIYLSYMAFSEGFELIFNG